MKRLRSLMPLLMACAVLAVAVRCAGVEEKRQGEEVKSVDSLEVTSPAFKHGEMIPKRHSCEGIDLSPALAWSKPPEGTKSLALVCEDPDAPGGIWVHWVVWGLPADSTSLPEAVSTDRILTSQARQGKNSWGRIGYGGPCPPPGSPHRYYFRLYALDILPELKPGATRQDLLKAIDGHLLSEGNLMGRYQR